MGQEIKVSQVRDMINRYGVQETLKKLSEEPGLSKEQINKLIDAAFAGKDSPAIDVVKFTMKVGDKDVGMKAPLGMDTELPMNEMAGTFAEAGIYKIETENDKLYGVYATGEKTELADVKQEHKKAKRAEAEKLLEESQAWRDAQMEAAKNLGLVAVAGIATSIAAAVILDVLAAKGVETAVAQTAVRIAMKEAPKMAINGYLNKAAVVTLVASAMTACEKYEFNDTDEQTVNMKFTLSNSTQLDKKLDTIIDLLSKLVNNDAVNFKALLSKLDLVINNQYDTKEAMEKAVDNAVKQIVDWLEKIYNEEVEIHTDNNKNAKEIADKLKEILSSNKSIEEKLKEITDLLGQIKSVGDEILAAIKAAKNELIATLNTNNQAVLDALAKLDENDQATLAVLNDIKDLIGKYGKDGKAMAEAILEAIGNISVTTTVDLSKVEALLEEINGKDYTGILGEIKDLLGKINDKDYTEQLAEIIELLKNLDANNDERNKKVLDAIEKLGLSVTAGMNAILEAFKNLPDYNDKLDTIIAKLDALGDKAKEILEAIKDHDVKITVDVTGKVKCECNCQCPNEGGVHEGILGELKDLLID